MLETIGRAIEAHALKAPQRQAYFDVATGEGRTYAELDDRTNRLANALMSAGLTPGDRVAFWMKSSIATAELIFAAGKCGIIATAINERFTVGEAEKQVENADAKGLVFSASLQEPALQLLGRRDFTLVASDSNDVHHGVVPLEQLIAEAPDARPAGPGPDDLLLLGYTSGTTGTPKGAMLTHRSVMAAGRMNAFAYRLPIGSRGLYRGSMSFSATIGSFLASHLFVGGTVVIIGTSDPAEIVEALVEHRCNYSSIATPLLGGFLAAVHERPEVLEVLTSIHHGASAAPPQLVRELAEALDGKLIEGWGMTEHSGGLVTATTRRDVTGDDEAVKDVYTSVGRAVPETLIRVVDDQRVALPHDGVSVGELAIKSPALGVGYWNMPEASAEAFEDGWYYTGDLGSIDANGYLYLSDRRSDLILSGGMNVYPGEIELAIRDLSGVEEVAVVGAPHPHWGQTVVAVVRAAPGSGLTEDAVISHCKEVLASFKKPTRVLFVDRLPKTASEKVRREQVRELVRELVTPVRVQ